MMLAKCGRLAVLAAAALLFPGTLHAQAPADDVPLEQRIEMCGSCHGADGNSPNAGVPDLAGQPRTFIETQMIYFRERLRQSDVMTPQAQGLSDETIVALAKHYANLPSKSRKARPDPALFDKGRKLAEESRCGTCHLPDYSGRNQMPRLAGQREDYLAQTMISYREQVRGGPDSTMIEIMRGVPDEDIKALAHYFAHGAGERPQQ